LRQIVEPGLTSQVVVEGKTVVAETTCANCGFLRKYGPGQCVIAPLRAGERTLGALCVAQPVSRRFEPEETRALVLLANSAAIAIDNARLIALERRQAEQSAVHAERERLAAELHDHLAQTLSFLNLTADRLQELLAAGFTVAAETELGRMKTAATTAYGQARAALIGLREPIHGEGNLTIKLEECLADFRNVTGLGAEFTVADPTALHLSRLAQQQALHIVREALTNVRRHAQAQQVQVRVERVDGEARFAVEDNGCGFDLAAVQRDGHLGLTIMQARAERSKGRLLIESTPGAGTKVVACFPLSGA
jgi:two-component system nitrate/nitrite sensor histidine kinase NarX